MTTNDQIANIAEQLLSKMSEIELAQAVQNSAYLALTRRLAAQDLLDIEQLAQDIETLGGMEPNAGWQSAHAEIAGGLRLIADLPSMRRK